MRQCAMIRWVGASRSPAASGAAGAIARCGCLRECAEARQPPSRKGWPRALVQLVAIPPPSDAGGKKVVAAPRALSDGRAGERSQLTNRETCIVSPHDQRVRARPTRSAHIELRLGCALNFFAPGRLIASQPPPQTRNAAGESICFGRFASAPNSLGERGSFRSSGSPRNVHHAV